MATTNPIPETIDYVAEYSGLLTSKLQTETVQGYLNALLERVQELEDSAMELRKGRYLKDMTGDRLDQRGELVGEYPRNGRTDAQYRQDIYNRIFINNSEGSMEDALSALEIITDATYVDVWNHYPASSIFVTNGSNIPSNLADIMTNICPVGVTEPVIALDPELDSLYCAEIDDDGLDERTYLAELYGSEVEDGLLTYAVDAEEVFLIDDAGFEIQYNLGGADTGDIYTHESIFIETGSMLDDQDNYLGFYTTEASYYNAYEHIYVQNDETTYYLSMDTLTQDNVAVEIEVPFYIGDSALGRCAEAVFATTK